MIKNDLTILDDLFSLWESLSLAGEVSIGSGFSKKYLDMKNRIKNFKISQEANCFPQRNQKTKRELITKHLEGWHGLKLASIQHFAEHGKASGSFLQSLESLLSEHSASLIKENEELRKALKRFVDDFEGDFVLDGNIVDNPQERWFPIIDIYNKQRNALNKDV